MKKTYRELAQAAARKSDRHTWYRRRVTKKRLAELIGGSYSTYAGEQAELIRGYCLYLAQRNSPNKENNGKDEQ